MIKRVVTAVVLIPLVLLLVLKAPLYVMAIVAGAVALLAIAEFQRGPRNKPFLVRERDFRFSAIAMLVLAIIILGAVLGMHMAGSMPG